MGGGPGPFAEVVRRAGAGRTRFSSYDDALNRASRTTLRAPTRRRRPARAASRPAAPTSRRRRRVARPREAVAPHAAGGHAAPLASSAALLVRALRCSGVCRVGRGVRTTGRRLAAASCRQRHAAACPSSAEARSRRVVSAPAPSAPSRLGPSLACGYRRTPPGRRRLAPWVAARHAAAVAAAAARSRVALSVRLPVAARRRPLFAAARRAAARGRTARAPPAARCGARVLPGGAGRDMAAGVAWCRASRGGPSCRRRGGRRAGGRSVSSEAAATVAAGRLPPLLSCRRRSPPYMDASPFARPSTRLTGRALLRPEACFRPNQPRPSRRVSRHPRGAERSEAAALARLDAMPDAMAPVGDIWTGRPVRGGKDVPVWREQVALLYSACSCRTAPAGPDGISTTRASSL